MNLLNESSSKDVVVLLRTHGISPTSQRIAIATLMFDCCEHLSAEDVFSRVNGDPPRVSKATVYNTLKLFAERGLIREVIADPSRIFYDPNTKPHHHFFDTSSGKLMDIPLEQVEIGSLPALPEGMKMEGVDVIVRMRPAPHDPQ